ncbi:MAG: hypothetical protein L6R40_000790 [Gallowayella cf. fulva]|nr:MAG: hypothetical protein L6R40_000790 [Xanthomendoza cf. fulva]
MSFRFLELPAEIRDQIYHEILSCNNARHPPADDDDPASYHFDLAILRTNRQIHHESKKAFQDNIFVKITTPWSESIDHISSDGRVPMITVGPAAESFKSFHLWVWIDAPGVGARETAYSMVISLDDLPAFTLMWRFSNLTHGGLNPHLRLKLILQDPHVPDRKIPKALQMRLLQPFGLVKSLHSFSLHGAMVLPSVEEALRKEQATPEPLPEECLETATTLKDAGNKSLQAKDYPTALQYYTDAFAAIHITVSGRKRYVHADGYYDREITSGTYTGQRSDYVRLMLRVKLVANFIQTYLKMEKWEEARFWGKRSIVLFRTSLTGRVAEDLDGDFDKDWVWAKNSAGMGFPAKDDMGKILYRTALASRELGYEKEDLNLIQAAAIYLPNDPIVQAEKKKKVDDYDWFG